MGAAIDRIIGDALDEITAERDRARATAAWLANRLSTTERLLGLVVQPNTTHAQDEETGRLITEYLASKEAHA